jgi:hypothetical protein
MTNKAEWINFLVFIAINLCPYIMIKDCISLCLSSAHLPGVLTPFRPRCLTQVSYSNLPRPA